MDHRIKSGGDDPELGRCPKNKLLSPLSKLGYLRSWNNVGNKSAAGNAIWISVTGLAI
jgi:hypothetical protein